MSPGLTWGLLRRGSRVKPGDAVAHLCREHEVSQRRACKVLSANRSSVRYQSIRPDDAQLGAAIRDIAGERRCFGYRRIHVMLEREGWQVNHKKPSGFTGKRDCRLSAEAAVVELWAYVNPHKMHSSRALTAAPETNVRTRLCSHHLRMHCVTSIIGRRIIM